MSQKGVPYIKVFSTLSEVRLLCCILSQLNILCSSLVKPCYSKMTIHPIFTFTCYGHFMCSLTCWISLKRSVPYIKAFSTLSAVRTVFWIWLQLHILCTSAVERYYAKNNNSSFKCHLFFRVLELWKQEKLATEYFGPQSGQFLTLENFATKIVSSRLPRRWSSEVCRVTLQGPE